MNGVKYKITIFFLVLLTGAMAHADDQATRNDLANQLVEIEIETLGHDGIVMLISNPIISQLEESGVSLSDDQKEQIGNVIDKRLYDDLVAAYQNNAKEIAEIYTSAELEALISFYKSGHGTSILSKLGQVQHSLISSFTHAIGHYYDDVRNELTSIIHPKANSGGAS